MTTLLINYVTDETVGNLRIAEIIKQSREKNTVWVFTPDHFKTVLWANLEENIEMFRARIDAMNLGKTFIGITNRNEIWFYTGTSHTHLLTIIKEQKWILITDTDIGTFDNTEVTLVTYPVYPAVRYTDEQKEVATFLFKTLTEGMIVTEGVVQWFIANEDLLDLLGERCGYVYCEGKTLYALPSGVKSIAFFRMITGKTNLVQIGINNEVFNAVIDSRNLAFNWTKPPTGKSIPTN